MADMFGNYPNAEEESVTPTPRSTRRDKWKRKQKEKELKILKALAKAMKKRNKLMEQGLEQRRIEREAAVDKAAAEMVASNKKEQGNKGFLYDLGKGFAKAIPVMLTTLATAVIGFFFRPNPSKLALQSR